MITAFLALTAAAAWISFAAVCLMVFVAYKLLMGRKIL
jgi:hypothetical protein